MSARNGRQDVDGHIADVSRDQGYDWLDQLTREYLGLTARDFMAAWREGKYRDEHEYPEAVRLSMMIPLAE